MYLVPNVRVYHPTKSSVAAAAIVCTWGELIAEALKEVELVSYIRWWLVDGDAYELNADRSFTRRETLTISNPIRMEVQVIDSRVRRVSLSDYEVSPLIMLAVRAHEVTHIAKNLPNY